MRPFDAITRGLLSFSFFAALLCSGAAGAQPAESAPPQKAAIQVKQVELRREPSALAPRVATLSYGSEVTVLDRNEDRWLRVEAGVAGWLRESAVTTSRLRYDSLLAKSAQINPDREEVAFAAKGLRELETSLAAGDKNLAAGFAAVDELEQSPRYQVDYQSLAEFMRAGNLKSGDRL